MNRADITFRSAGTRCAGWLYRPTDTEGDRYLGDSEGAPRQRVRMSEHRMGFSLSGGTALEAAAADNRVAGAILLCPFLDGRWRTNHGMRLRPRTALWLTGRAMRDAPIPVTNEPGGRGGLTFPGERAGFESITAPGWRNEVHAGMALPLPFWRPVVHARKPSCPVLIQAGRRDISVAARAIDRVAQQARRATLKHYDVDHFEPFHAEHSAAIIADQVNWLQALPRG